MLIVLQTNKYADYSELIVIPECDHDGVLPPLAEDGSDVQILSPFRVTIIEFVDRFAYTRERREILNGFLRFRRELTQRGIIQGFQWIDGSFVEDVETTEKRAPNDIDVVTFFELPSGTTEKDLVDDGIVDHDRVKDQFKTDAYFYIPFWDWNPSDVEMLVYWSTLFSHRRDRIWKGYIQIELTPELDIIAVKKLNEAGVEDA
jgi:hypothetical protein